MTDEAIVLIGDTNLDGRDFRMIGHLDGFGAKDIALLGTRHIHDAVADAESELTVVIHQGGNGKVGKGEQGAALTHMTAVEMFSCHSHHGYSVMFVDFCYLATCIGCKAISTIQ